MPLGQQALLPIASYAQVTARCVSADSEVPAWVYVALANREEEVSRRADSNRWPALYECAVSGC